MWTKNENIYAILDNCDIKSYFVLHISLIIVIYKNENK